MLILNSYIKNQKGNISVIVSIASLLLLTCAASAIDLGTMASQKSKLQDAADAAALAGAVSLGNGGRNIEQTAHEKAHDFAKSVNDTTMDGFESDVILDVDAETVEVKLKVGVPRLFSGVFLVENPTVKVRSIAKVLHEGTSCLYALDPTGDDALKSSGSATVNAVNCNIQVNSSSAFAMSNSGSASFNADNICVVGGYTGSGYNPTPDTCPAAPDPFATLSIPTAGICDYTDYSTGADDTLLPGTYCGGIKVNGGARVTLAAGNYIIEDGTFIVSGGSSVEGSEVSIVLGTDAFMNVSGTGDFILSPPTSGDLAGFSIVQSASMPVTKTIISGDGNVAVTGIMYLPSSNLEISGSSTGNAYTPSYAAIIAHRVNISGSGALNVTADTDGYSQVASAGVTSSSARLIQ